MRWMVVGEPQSLADNTEISPALVRLFPSARLDAFERGSGLDLRRVPTALVAGFDYATLYAAQTRGDNQEVQVAFARRALTDVKRRAPHPELSLLSGIVGSTPQTMVTVRDRFVAVSVGDPTPARVMSLFVQGRLRKAVPALRGAALSTLPTAELERGEFRFYAPGPFDGEWTLGARGLLLKALAVGASVKLNGRDADLTVVVSGPFDPATDITAAETAWQDLAQHPLGRLLGLSEPERAPEVRFSEDALRLHVILDLGPILLGLHSAVAADVWEMMEFLPAPQGSHPAGTAPPRAPSKQ